MAQAVECQLCNREALSSNPNPAKNQNKTKKERKRHQVSDPFRGSTHRHTLSRTVCSV
jgi:hypothetical protein